MLTENHNPASMALREAMDELHAKGSCGLHTGINMPSVGDNHPAAINWWLWEETWREETQLEKCLR